MLLTPKIKRCIPITPVNTLTFKSLTFMYFSQSATPAIISFCQPVVAIIAIFVLTITGTYAIITIQDNNYLRGVIDLGAFPWWGELFFIFNYLIKYILHDINTNFKMVQFEGIVLVSAIRLVTTYSNFTIVKSLFYGLYKRFDRC